MSILNRYVSKEIIRLFFIILLFVVTLYMVIDFIDRSGKFVKAGLSFDRIVLYFAYNIPAIIVLIMPLGFLMSVLIAIGLMAKNNELLALRSSGVGTYFLFKPVFFIGILAASALFFLSESIAPSYATKARHIWLKEVKKKDIMAQKGRMNTWIRGDRHITHINYIDLTESVINGVTIYRFDEKFKLIERVDAKRGIYKEGKGWEIEDAMVQELNASQNAYDVTFRDRMDQSFDFLPTDLKRGIKKSDEMSIYELADTIKKVKKEGYDATSLKVDFHAKIADPFSCLVLGLLALAIASRKKISEGVAVSVVFGLGIAFSYFVLFSFTVTLGYGGKLPPFVAAWFSNAVFSVLATWLLFRSDG